MTSNKILPVALVAALLGGTVGAFVMRPSKTAQPEVAQATAPAPRTSLVAGTSTDKTAEAKDNELIDNELASETKNMSEAEKDAFRDGFIEGIRTARENSNVVGGTATRTTATRVVNRPVTRTRYVARNEAPRRVYYDYGQRSGRSFWQKHRDKLTVAMGTGGGALIGGLVGGKKGALIGGLAGAGGSALYTYKIRKRSPRY